MNSTNISEYVIKVNQKALDFNLRSLNFVPPKGFIIACYCKNGKVVLIQSNGRGGTELHVTPKHEQFDCMERNRPRSLLSIVKNIFK